MAFHLGNQYRFPFCVLWCFAEGLQADVRYILKPFTLWSRSCDRQLLLMTGANYFECTVVKNAVIAGNCRILGFTEIIRITILKCVGDLYYSSLHGRL